MDRGSASIAAQGRGWDGMMRASIGVEMTAGFVLLLPCAQPNNKQQGDGDLLATVTVPDVVDWKAPERERIG
jgi:hypothetical protein